MFLMPIVIKKKEKETTASLLRRFTRLVQKSGVLVDARKNQFYSKKKNKRQLREGAKRREVLLTERRKLEKLGLIDAGQPIPKDQLRRIQQEKNI